MNTQARGLCSSAIGSVPITLDAGHERSRARQRKAAPCQRPRCCLQSDSPAVDPATAVQSITLGRRAVLAAGSASALFWSAGARAFVDEYESLKIYSEERVSIVGIADVENPGGAQKVTPTGTGFIWDQRGTVVTSASAVIKLAANQAQETRVYWTAPDGSQRQARARLLGLSQEYNVAVLSVEAPEDSLKPVELGVPSALRVGQSCYVIGKQGIQGQTITHGVVSGLNRRIAAANGAVIRRAIQTDADVSGENSGGALFDSSGRMIGMTLIPLGRNIARAPGVNFAMPIDTLMQVIPQLVAYGELKTPIQEPADAGPQRAVRKI